MDQKKNNPTPPNRHSKTKRFDTTTKLNLHATFDEDEVTIRDEIPDPESIDELNDYEKSVTEKLPLCETSENLDISEKLHRIENNLREPTRDDALSQKMLNFIKLIALVFLESLSKWVNKILKIRVGKKSVKILILATGTLLFLIGFILLINKTIHHFGNRSLSQKKSSITRTLEQAQIVPIKLSPVELYSLKEEKLNSNNVKAGSSLLMICYVTSWNAKPDEKLSLSADVRIYSGRGKLEVYGPNYLEYSSTQNTSKDKIKIKTKLKLSDDIPLGYYRVLITVTELSTQRKANIQTRIKVVP